MLQRFVFLLVVTFLSTPALAQDTNQRWNDLNSSDLSTVSVLDELGALWTGEVLRLDADGLDIEIEGVGQEKHFAVVQVQRLDRRGTDSLRNGALTGAIVGGIVGFLLSGDLEGPVVVAPIYSVVGVGIDALIRGEQWITIYEAPGTSAGRRQPFGGRGQSKSVMLDIAIRW